MNGRRTIVLSVTIALALGCGKSESEQIKERNAAAQNAMEVERLDKQRLELEVQKEVEAKKKAQLTAPDTGAVDAAREIKIASVANTMTYDVTALKAKAGEKLRIVFHNNSTDALLPHNWALVRPGTEAAVAAAGLSKGAAAGYIEPGPSVLAVTPLAARGETVEVTFTAPAAGTYPYICTVPGHYMMMKGTFVVSP
jgi:azurin